MSLTGLSGKVSFVWDCCECIVRDEYTMKYREPRKRRNLVKAMAQPGVVHASCGVCEGL